MFAVDKERRDADTALCFECLNAATLQRTKNVRPIVIDRTRQRSWLTQCFLINCYVFIRERPAPDACLLIHLLDPCEIVCARPPFRQTRQLKKEHVPTMSQLPKGEVRTPCSRRRHLHCY